MAEKLAELQEEVFEETGMWDVPLIVGPA